MSAGEELELRALHQGVLMSVSTPSTSLPSQSAAAHPLSHNRPGCYLPVTAALGGLLFLRPSGYREASRDVVRLSPDINHLLSQQVGQGAGVEGGEAVVRTGWA